MGSSPPSTSSSKILILQQHRPWRNEQTWASALRLSKLLPFETAQNDSSSRKKIAEFSHVHLIITTEIPQATQVTDGYSKNPNGILKSSG